MESFWFKISHLGIVKKQKISSPEEKRLIFFNQVILIGTLATFLQIIFVFPFIGTKSLVFLIADAALILSLFLNSKGKFKQSKWLYLLSIYSTGVLTTLLLGGSSLYHIQAILIFASCLILFDLKDELLQIAVGIPFVFACIAIGEFDILPVPDFSEHWWNDIARLANITSLFFITTLLITFIIRLNSKNERDLTIALAELNDSAEELRRGKENLEEIVLERTSKLNEQRDILQKQNEEKALLLKEVHHRVKNNLQIIISLINFQLAKLNNPETIEALKEVQNRIHSMSLVHQKMYQSSNFKEVSLKEYTNSIVENISEILSDPSFEFTTDIPDELLLDIETAIPTGLIINEIISNFFKHNSSFNGVKKSFHIEVKNDNNGKCILTYNDNGNGFPEGYQLDDSKSLGLQLINTLSEQLEGDFKFFNKDGAVYIISLPEEPHHTLS